MTEVGDETQPAMCYPHEDQYEIWKEQAEAMDYKSVSRFMIEMVEVGYKQMDLSVGYDEDTTELREQRNDLKRELDQTRERLQRLEEQLYRGERQAILDFLDDQAGATFAELVQHIIDDAPARVAHLIEEMDGDDIVLVDGEYYVREDDDAE